MSEARAITTRTIDYTVDGEALAGVFAAPDPGAGLGPAVLVAHDGVGISEHSLSAARRLAALGYRAFAIDYLGGGVARTDIRTARDRMAGFEASPLTAQPRILAGLAQLLSQPGVDGARVGAIGYCFGGTAVLDLARSGAAIRATVALHGVLSSSRPARAGDILGRVLVCTGAADPLIPPDQRSAFEQEMEAAGVDWSLHLYGGVVHAFTNRDADNWGAPVVRYDRAADLRSWRETTDLLRDALQP